MLTSQLQASQNHKHPNRAGTHPDSSRIPQILSSRTVKGLGSDLNFQYADPKSKILPPAPTSHCHVFLYVMFRGLAWDGATVFETHVKHGFELDLNHSDARPNRLRGELQHLMGSRPILIDFPGGIMTQNPFFHSWH